MFPLSEAGSGAIVGHTGCPVVAVVGAGTALLLTLRRLGAADSAPLETAHCCGAVKIIEACFSLRAAVADNTLAAWCAAGVE